MQRQTMAAMLSCAVFCAAEGAINDAGWDVRDYPERPVIEVINMNKLSWREYQFDRDSGQVSRICFNVMDPVDRLVDGAATFSLICGGRERKATFVSMEAKADGELRWIAQEKRRPEDILATVTSRYRIAADDIDVTVTYQFKRGNDVDVTWAVATSAPLPDDTELRISYPISRDYTGVKKERPSGDMARAVELTRESGYHSLVFRACSDFDNVMLARVFDGARMSVSVTKNKKPKCATHDKLVTLGKHLKDPAKLPDGRFEYVFRYIIPIGEL